MSQSDDNEFSETERHFHPAEQSDVKPPLTEAQKLRRRIMDLDRSICMTRQSQRQFLIQVQMASAGDVGRDPVRILSGAAGSEISGRVVDWD